MSTARDIEKIVCHRCYAVLDVGDNYCRRCGEPQGPVAGPSLHATRFAPDSSDRPLRWTEHRWVVLVALFMVIGPLALPMLWRSRRFSLLWKTVLTSLVVGLAAVLVWIVWYYMYQALEPLRELRNFSAR